ncbi:MAG: hypothetical protein ACREKL_07265 [Chthoniobacterales bacterium]
MTRVLFAGVMILSPALAAPMQDDAPLDSKALAASLEAMTKAREAQKKSYLEGARQKLAQHMGGAGDYVLACMKEIVFGNKSISQEYSDWKKSHRDFFSSQDFERAAGLHLRYLALTLKRATVDDEGAVLPEIRDYVGALEQCKDLVGKYQGDGKQQGGGGQGPQGRNRWGGQNNDNNQGNQGPNFDDSMRQVLNGPVGEGWVAVVLGLNGQLSDIENWEFSPSNLGGILEKNVRPYLREKKDPKLIETWDMEIAFQSAVAQATKDERKIDTFQRQEMPKLLWNKAKDYEVLGLPNRALKERIAIIKAYPDNPDFDAWTKEVMQQLNSSKAAATGDGATETPASTPAPPSAPST